MLMAERCRRYSPHIFQLIWRGTKLLLLWFARHAAVIISFPMSDTTTSLLQQVLKMHWYFLQAIDKESIVKITKFHSGKLKTLHSLAWQLDFSENKSTISYIKEISKIPPEHCILSCSLEKSTKKLKYNSNFLELWYRRKNHSNNLKRSQYHSKLKCKW